MRVNTVPLKFNDDGDLNINDLNSLKSEDMSFELKRIKDLSGKKIYKRQDLIGYQFRELFVQEVFTSNNIPEEILLINKNKPLMTNQINLNLGYKRYWINSLLKSTRNN